MAEDKGKKTKRPTAVKRDLQNAKKALVNKVFKSRVRTGLRRFDEAVKQGGKDLIKEQLSNVYSLMDRGVKRGIFKLNKANRTKRRFTARAMERMA